MRLRVFLIEDDVHTREYVKHELESQPGIRVVGSAESQPAAQKWLDANPHGWDLAVLDLFLVEGTGSGVLRHCRSRGVIKPIVVYTNRVESGLVKSLLSSGADDVFSKLDSISPLVDYCVKHQFELNMPLVVPGSAQH